MNFSREILHKRHRLSHAQIDQLLGEETIKKYLPQKLHRLKQLGLFLQLTKDLRERDIWFMIIKGPLLSERLYGDPTFRVMRDFDLLVKPVDVGRAVQIFKAYGYEPDNFSWPQSEKKQKIAASLTNQYLMRNREDNIVAELHWNLFTVRLTKPERLQKILDSNSETTTFSGQPFHVFSREFELLYLIIHGGLHAWNRLKWLADIRAYLDKLPPNNEAFNKLVTELHAHRFVDVCNAALEKYFPGALLLPNQGTDVSKAAAYVFEQIEHESGDPKETLSEKVAEFRYKMSLSGYLPYKRSLAKVFGSTKNDLNYDFLPPYKLFFYLFRPFGYLHRKFS